MCGILCEIFNDCSPSKDEKLLQRIKQRGPDCMETLVKKVSGSIEVIFRAAVLWMQGLQLTPQPVEDDSGILLFNGDIFDRTWTNKISDTMVIMDKLRDKESNYGKHHIIKVIRSLKGPFALIYYDKVTNNLYFTRDRIGRSSLLFHLEDSTRKITLSSVLGRSFKGCLEVPAAKIYSYNIHEHIVHVYSWTDDFEPEMFSLSDWMTNLESEQSLPDDEFSFAFDSNIDLNDNDNMIDFIQNAANETTDKFLFMSKLLAHPSIAEVVSKIVELLQDSVKIRLTRQPSRCKDCLLTEASCDHCTVGILFSGGLDCTILAFLADKFLPDNQDIDLINVAFRKGDATFDVPDRITGRQSYEELKKLRPERTWNFMEVNVEVEELEEYQQSTIADLVYPRKTILDESLGSALWFAARGCDQTTMSSCRVLLLGSGADEMFGGYTRHRNAFKRRGWTGLSKELMLDWNRISIRNLSRDNRVISHHGRQPRMPYLDDIFTEYVLQLKPWFKCFPSEQLGPGVGDKLMLRLVAHSLGLSKVVCLPKRALQFGTKIANKKERGSDISRSFLCDN